MNNALSYFLLAAFLTAAALWRAGAPMVPVLIGILAVAFWKLLLSLRAER